MTKTKANYFKQHEKTVVEDVLEAVKKKDFNEVREIFHEYGRFLERHEEALAVK
jgi:hypothetical protein